jgi:hypothetical protein
MRNAILAADTGTTGGANHPEIWQTFATRGMGYFASSTDTMDAAPVENMNMPPQATDPKGTVAGQITDGDTGQPLAGAAVGLSGHDSDPTFGEYLADTTDGTGHYIINNVPVGTYPKLAVHVAEPGWDIGEIQDVVIKDGAQTDVNVPLRFNWASLAAKGKVVSPIGDQDQYADLGCGADMAHDQARGTGWSSDVSADPAVAPALTIKLAQTIDVTRFAVDPSPICGDAATAAAAHVVIETSADGTTFAPAVDHTFGAGDVGHSSLLTPTGGTSGVRFVRIRLLSNQGSPYYVDLTEFAAYGNAIPRGTLAASPTSLQPGGTVNLDASSFVDPDGTVETYEWDFDGNGTVDDTTTAPNVSHVYPNAGTFQVRVAARDDRGGRGAATATVTVNPPPVITTPPPQPPGDTNPPVEEPPVVKQKARLSLSRHGKRGRTTFKVVCKDRCRVGATLTISNRLRRQIRNSVRTVGRIKARPILGTVKVTITLTKRARQHFRKYRVRRFKVVLRVTAAVVGGERTVRTKTVTLRV